MDKKVFQKNIKVMYDADQHVRRIMLDNGLNTPGSENHGMLVYLTDTVHGAKLEELVSKHGFPRQSSVGKKCMQQFWLLIQHQDNNLPFQKEALQRCDFEKREYAHLFDRIAIAENRKQRYGTQFTIENGLPILSPVEDLANLKSRQAEMNVLPVEKSMAKLKKQLKSSKLDTKD